MKGLSKMAADALTKDTFQRQIEERITLREGEQ